MINTQRGKIVGKINGIPEKMDQETVVEMVQASEYHRKEYGIMYESARVFRVNGKGLYNPGHPHRITVWDNTVRPNGNGEGRYIAPDGKGTDDLVTITVDAQAMASGDSINYSAVVLTLGQALRLFGPGDEISSHYEIRARKMADPILVPID